MTASKASEAPPDGFYDAKVERARVGKTVFGDESVLHYVEIRFSLTSGAYRGRLFEWKEWLTAGGMMFLAPTLVECGLRGSDPSNVSGLVGSCVRIELYTIECVEAPGIVKTCVGTVSARREQE